MRPFSLLYRRNVDVGAFDVGNKLIWSSRRRRIVEEQEEQEDRWVWITFPEGISCASVSVSLQSLSCNFPDPCMLFHVSHPAWLSYILERLSPLPSHPHSQKRFGTLVCSAALEAAEVYGIVHERLGSQVIGVRGALQAGMRDQLRGCWRGRVHLRTLSSMDHRQGMKQRGNPTRHSQLLEKFPMQGHRCPWARLPSHPGFHC